MLHSRLHYIKYLKGKVSGLLRTLEMQTGVNPATAKILDFGCQRGELVTLFRDEGLNVHGFDVREDAPPPFVKYGSFNPYRIPWEDNSFDVIFSHHVIEHVLNTEETISEMRRVLRPGGATIHIFPARLRLFEAHYFTPFGGVFNARWWCAFWRRVGLVKDGRKHMSVEDYAAEASHEIRHNMNYVPDAELLAIFSASFDNLETVTDTYFENMSGKTLPPFMAPVFNYLVSRFHARVLIAQ